MRMYVRVCERSIRDRREKKVDSHDPIPVEEEEACVVRHERYASKQKNGRGGEEDCAASMRRPTPPGICLCP
jgi:hypothetical protein